MKIGETSQPHNSLVSMSQAARVFTSLSTKFGHQNIACQRIRQDLLEIWYNDMDSRLEEESERLGVIEFLKTLTI